jgi:gluconate 2-dehydrogenase gamma chain
MTAKLSIGRRMFLLKAAAPVAGAAVLGAARQASSQAAPPRQAYQPSYFTADEWAFITTAVNRLIPADGSGPGGVDAGVPEFIDRQLEMPYGHGAFTYMQGPFQPGMPPTLGYQLPFTPRELYRQGIADANRACMAQYGAAFAKLPPARQDAFLGLLEAGRVATGGLPSAAFFAQLLENTQEGYFADPMYGGNRAMSAWKMIGFPGARADFTDWIDQAGHPYPYGPVSIAGERA